MERCDKVSCDGTGHRPVCSRGLIRVWESNPRMIDWKNGDRSPRDLGCVPLKEGREECVAQRVLSRLELCTYVRGDALHKSPLLMEGLLQARVGGLRVLDCHPVHQ